MKKILLVAAVTVVMTVPLFAEKITLVQGTYLNTSRTYTGYNRYTGYDGDVQYNFGQVGLNFTNFNGQGQGLGFYSCGTFLIPMSNTVTNDDYPSGYSNFFRTVGISLDALLGLGFLIPLVPSFSLLGGAGLHFNGITYISDISLACNFGVGGALNAILQLTKSLNVNVSGMVAWDMLEFISRGHFDLATKKGGLTWAVSIGMGYNY